MGKITQTMGKSSKSVGNTKIRISGTIDFAKNRGAI